MEKRESVCDLQGREASEKTNACEKAKGGRRKEEEEGEKEGERDTMHDFLKSIYP